MDQAAAYIEAGNQAGAECLAAALDYLRRGWCPLPLCPPDHVGVRTVGHSCDSPGKTPWIPWKEFQERRPTEAEVRDWWRRLPNSNVGLALGPVSGLVGIDVDGMEARDAFLLWYRENGSLPQLMFNTPGGGVRMLFDYRDGLCTRSFSFLDGEVRLQAKGAQTVMPPSRHVSGKRYPLFEGVRL